MGPKIPLFFSIFETIPKNVNFRWTECHYFAKKLHRIKDRVIIYRLRAFEQCPRSVGKMKNGRKESVYSFAGHPGFDQFYNYLITPKMEKLVVPVLLRGENLPPSGITIPQRHRVRKRKENCQAQFQLSLF